MNETQRHRVLVVDDEPDLLTLYELTLGRGRYVAGFAQAFNIGPDTFREIAALKVH